MAFSVDVILPVYNGARYLEAALASLLQDSDPISKIIAIDDGSTDATSLILARFSAVCPKIKVLRQPRAGLVTALNRGLAASNSTYIARMDADDISLPGRFLTQMRYLEKYPHISVVGAQAAYIDEKGTLAGSQTQFPLLPHDVRSGLLNKGCVLCHPSILARREAVLAVGGYRKAFKHAEDYDLWLRLSEKSQLANLPDVFLQYRQHDSQISSSTNLRQSFSRDLALYAAKERGAGRVDPTAHLTGVPAFGDAVIKTSLHGTIVDLGRAYEAIELINNGCPSLVSRAALASVVRLAQQRYLGETRKRRYRMLQTAYRIALKRFELRLGGYAAYALWRSRIIDSRFFRKRLATL
jgi:glycosyltransferase involved in cell wall biosynthesis